MARTCRERVNDVTGISLYREIVQKLIPFSGEYIPDPVEYAEKLDGDPIAIRNKGRHLGSDDGTTDLHERYSTILENLKTALSNTELAYHWEGRASDRFTDTYLPELHKHIGRLAGRCSAQKKIAAVASSRLGKAHDDLVGHVEVMVRLAIAEAVVFGAFGIAAAAPTAGLGTAATAAGAYAALLVTVTEGIATLKKDVSDYNADLADPVEDLRGLERVKLSGISTGVEPEDVTRDGWRM